MQMQRTRSNFLQKLRFMRSRCLNMLNRLFPGIAFLVAAYIIHYGIRLQDEVDHTL